MQKDAEDCRSRIDAYLFSAAGTSMNKSDRALKQGLRAIAVDYRLTFEKGTKALAKLVDAHLDWFTLAQKRGTTWGDMIAALTSVGVVSPTAKPISIGTLSSTVGRKREAIERVGSKSHQSQRLFGSRSLKHTPIPASIGSRSPEKRKQKKVRLPEAAELSSRPKMPMSAGAADSNSHQLKRDLLDYMNRARSVRSKSERD